jgi:hypothetical protein
LTVDAASATDQTIDAFATYVYRVRALAAGDVVSAPSNEITVGPPPVGFSQVQTAPKAMQDRDPNQYAHTIRLAFDANGDPALAYVTGDLNLDGDPKDSEIGFISWNRARYRWNAAVRIDGVADVVRSGSRPPLSLARDTSTNRWVLVYMGDDGHLLNLATSDDNGTSWKLAPIERAGPEDGTMSTPSVVAASGQIYLAYFAGGNRVRYRNGLLADPPNKWTSAEVPLLPNTDNSRQECINVALDAAGKPLVFSCLNPSEGYTINVSMWRPGERSAVKVLDTDGHQTDDPALAVTIAGNTIAAVMYANRDQLFFENHQIWFARSTDGGATWPKPIVIENDGGHGMGSPLSIAIDRAGHFAGGAEHTGGNSDGTKCGDPKLFRSSDGVRWTVCAPNTRGVTANDVTYPVVAFAGNDKIYEVFKTRQPSGNLVPGLALWREP